MKPEHIEAQSRKEIAKALPCAIKTAMDSYRIFTAAEQSADAKDFKAHHDACKVAIAHIQLLIKLAEWVGAKTGDGGIDDALMAQILESSREVDAYQSSNSNEGGTP